MPGGRRASNDRRKSSGRRKQRRQKHNKDDASCRSSSTPGQNSDMSGGSRPSSLESSIESGMKPCERRPSTAPSADRVGDDDANNLLRHRHRRRPMRCLRTALCSLLAISFLMLSLIVFWTAAKRQEIQAPVVPPKSTTADELTPRYPAYLHAEGSEALDETKACKRVSEPRFNSDVNPCDSLPALGTPERMQSYQKCLAVADFWLQRYGIQYTTIGYALLNALAHEQNPKQQLLNAKSNLVMSHPCEIVVASSDFDQIARMLTQAASRFSHGGVKTDVAERLNMAMHKGATQRYEHKVIEDEPWNIRSRVFPQFEGEFWAPLDKLGDSGKDMGLLLKPKDCKQLRFMHKSTGLFCDVLAAEEEGTFWFVPREGSSHSCPSHSNRCNTQQCLRLDSADILPVRKCTIMGEKVSCPKNIDAALKGFLASTVNGNKGQS